MARRWYPEEVDRAEDSDIEALINERDETAYFTLHRIYSYLAKRPNYKSNVENIGTIAKRLGKHKKTIESIIKEFGLFVIEKDGTFYAQHVLKAMTLYDKKAEGGKLGADRRWSNDSQQE